MIELVTFATERNDTSYKPHGERSKWTYFTCAACHRRCRRLRGAGQPAPKCYRPDCAIEMQRWPIRFAINRAMADGMTDTAAYLATLLDSEDILGGTATFYQPEPTPAPTVDVDDDTTGLADAGRAAIDRPTNG